MEIKSSGNDMVDALGKMHLTGNIVPHAWYQTITRENGKPHFLAILILADIVYWYRPSKIQDASNGEVTGYKKKFHADLLQRAYQTYVDLYGESKRSVKAAFDKLESLGIIERIFRTIKYGNGLVAQNVMFIKLNVDVLREITYSKSTIVQDEQDINILEESTIDKKDNTKTVELCDNKMYSGIRDGVAGVVLSGELEGQNNVSPGVASGGTNTKTTSHISSIDYNNHIYQDNVYTMDEIETYREMIKANINYEVLKMDNNVNELNELVELIVETLISTKPTMSIGDNTYSADYVKKRLMSLDGMDIRHALLVLEKNTTKVHNPKKYLLATLFNIRTTMEWYYTMEVNHDLYG